MNLSQSVIYQKSMKSPAVVLCVDICTSCIDQSLKRWRYRQHMNVMCAIAMIATVSDIFIPKFIWILGKSMTHVNVSCRYRQNYGYICYTQVSAALWYVVVLLNIISWYLIDINITRRSITIYNMYDCMLVEVDQEWKLYDFSILAQWIFFSNLFKLNEIIRFIKCFQWQWLDVVWLFKLKCFSNGSKSYTLEM